MLLVRHRIYIEGRRWKTDFQRKGAKARRRKGGLTKDERAMEFPRKKWANLPVCVFHILPRISPNYFEFLPFLPALSLFAPVNPGYLQWGGRF
jgi:hypothetical protein